MSAVAKVSHRIVHILAAPARLLERSRGRKRLALVIVYLLIASVFGVLAWRESTLRGLPDVGDPFDVKAYEAERASDADDAYPLYRQAFARLKPLPQNLGVRMPNLKTQVALASGRPPDEPVYHRWVRENAEALRLWRQAAEKPDVDWPRNREWRWRVFERMEELSWLAAERAQRAESDGDALEAWGWRRAILRSYRHFTRRGDGMTRNQAIHAIYGLRGPILRGVIEADEKALRRMLADLKVIVAMTPPNSETIKAEYLNALDMLPLQSPRSPMPSEYSEFRWYELNPGYQRARKFLLHEPERSRRLLSIVASNQLAYADRPTVDRLPIVAPGMYDTSFDPPAPRSAHLLDPPAAATWADTAMERPDLFQSSVANSDRDRHDIEDLLLDVARELYRRDHAGKLPPDAATLVGPYLDTLPEVSKAMGETMP